MSNTSFDTGSSVPQLSLPSLRCILLCATSDSRRSSLAATRVCSRLVTSCLQRPCLSLPNVLHLGHHGPKNRRLELNTCAPPTHSSSMSSKIMESCPPYSLHHRPPNSLNEKHRMEYLLLTATKLLRCCHIHVPYPECFGRLPSYVFRT